MGIAHGPRVAYWRQHLKFIQEVRRRDIRRCSQRMEGMANWLCGPEKWVSCPVVQKTRQVGLRWRDCIVDLHHIEQCNYCTYSRTQAPVVTAVRRASRYRLYFYFARLPARYLVHPFVRSLASPVDLKDLASN
jgi:hypothetical protein